MPENWNLAKARSHNHDMYAGIFEWLYRSLAGILPDMINFRKRKIDFSNKSKFTGLGN